MDTPSVQYVTTSDRIQIAYSVAGEGECLINLPFHHNDVRLRWSGPLWFRGTAQHFRVTHYDSRGQGLSTRGLKEDPTVDDYLCDLETVIQATGADRFALMAYGGFGHVALRYATDNPDRVTALVLICSCASFSAWTQSAFLDVAEENWDLFLELQTRQISPKNQARARDWLRAMSSQEDYVRLVRCFISSSDITDLLPRVTMPTFLLHSLDQHWLPPAEGANLAAQIPGARILFTDGDIEPDDRQAVPAIVDFLEGVSAPSIGPEPSGVISSPTALSRRQMEVLYLVSEGKRTREIAEELVLSERTVERHIADVYAKIGARNRSEATAYVLNQLQNA
jgi:pimeloyl-ACP methyl ester carboxylesterase/DNA-binding CsgD family transcriptional regulator